MINNIYCIGRNYVDHAKELGNKLEDKPVVFSKPNTSLIKGNEIVLPDFSNDIHFEVEVVIRVSKKCYKVTKDYANDYFDAIAIGLDLTARDLQTDLKNKKLPWLLSKGFKNSCYISEFIDKTNFSEEINFGLLLNDKVVQSGNTNDMIFNFNDIISFISQFIELDVGDVIFTGTPSGVGKLSTNDKLKLTINHNIISELSVR